MFANYWEKQLNKSDPQKRSKKVSITQVTLRADFFKKIIIFVQGTQPDEIVIKSNNFTTKTIDGNWKIY